MTAVRWLNCRLRDLQERLAQQAHIASLPTLSRLLRQDDFRLRANVKSREGSCPPERDAQFVEGSCPPERDAQFVYLQQQRQAFMADGQPVLSVDTKKKELLGDFKNAGRIWCREAEAVNVHDFPSDGVGRAVPYGLYDLAHNKATVYVGQSADTAEFAADSLAHWCEHEMPVRYPQATSLLLHGDCGGSNGSRCRLWKQQLQEKIADRFGLAVTVCHLPTGCSKWNPIEHRVFSEISKTWAGCPLRDYETVLGYLRQTTTRGTDTQAGLTVTAHLVTQVYQKGLKVSEVAMAAMNLTRHEVCPQWNYTLHPRQDTVTA
jgi:hypothetical protein